MNKVSFSLLLFLLSLYSVLAQPYYPTHVDNAYVKENHFKTVTPDTSSPPVFNDVRDQLPQPYWQSRDDVIDCYWKTWETAFSNLKKVNVESGFISPYIDPAFNGNIFMWDCSFMTMFGKYASRVFDFQQTLDNFYGKQHPDGFICREIRGNDGTDVFERFDPSSTGPNIMPWSEWEYFNNFGDLERLNKVFPVLLSFYQWYYTYRTWPDGTYYSSGWGCGMDNQHRVPENFNTEFSHGFMSWIDISFQELFSGKILIQMSEILQRENEVLEIKNNIDKLEKFINENMWDEKENFYFDRYKNGELSSTKSIASYWALLAEAVPTKRLDNFVHHLSDTSKFNRKHRVPTLSADDDNFESMGGYWNGAVWAPTNYMLLKGLTKNKFDSLAYQIALNHLNKVVEVYSKTGDIWENYSSDHSIGNDRTNFVGWTGLVPINVLFEYVFGIRPDFTNNELLIDINLSDAYGIKNYPFGNDGLLDIDCKARKSIYDKPDIVITSNIAFKLKVKWQGMELTKDIKIGKNKI